jgi:hypothetical protein
LYNRYRVFLRVKAAGAGIDHKFLSRAEVKKKLYLYLSGFSWPVLG